MRHIYHTTMFMVLVMGIMSCGSTQESKISQYSSEQISYDSFLNTLVQKKKGISRLDYIEARELLFNTIYTDIPKYWVGTKWDFNGTTQVPNQGSIACGYFLTTTMQQTGYNIERVRMAQQASSVLIKEYCSDIKITSSLHELKKYLSKQPDHSCFIIGLDFHTGFVVKDGINCYLIHSNYINKEGVVKENIDNSKVLARNKYFMIGSLSKHENRLENWMAW